MDSCSQPDSTVWQEPEGEIYHAIGEYGAEASVRLSQPRESRERHQFGQLYNDASKLTNLKSQPCTDHRSASSFRNRIPFLPEGRRGNPSEPSRALSAYNALTRLPGPFGKSSRRTIA